MKTKLFSITIALFFVSASLRADVPVGNFWHNPTFEAGVNLNLATGTPDFWNRGGSDTTVDQVSTANSVSSSHSLAVIDNSLGFGEWYSDLPLAGLANSGDTIALHWHEIFSTSADMRLTVRFLDAQGNGPDNHFIVNGNSAGWAGSLASSTFTVRNQQLVVRTDLVNPVVTMRIALVSGGPESGTGQYIIDDLSVVVVPEPSTIALLSLGGLVGLGGLLRRRKIAR